MMETELLPHFPRSKVGCTAIQMRYAEQFEYKLALTTAPFPDDYSLV